MLPKINLVKKALSKLHTSICVVHTYADDVQDPVTGIVKQGKRTSQEYPCRVSFKSAPTASDENIAVATQNVTLFLDADIVIPPGSDVDVIQNGRTLHYKASGVPSVYQSHQEIPLAERTKYHGER